MTPDMLVSQMTCKSSGLLLLQVLRRHASTREPIAAQVHAGERVSGHLRILGKRMLAPAHHQSVQVCILPSCLSDINCARRGAGSVKLDVILPLPHVGRGVLRMVT